ncbi:MAG: hypothetical protein AAGF56_13835, partial [Pseudomonadota bacterium]
PGLNGMPGLNSIPGMGMPTAGSAGPISADIVRNQLQSMGITLPPGALELYMGAYNQAGGSNMNVEMPTLNVLPGETTEQALKRELDAVAPLMMDQMLAHSQNGHPARDLIGPMLKKNCADMGAAAGSNPMCGNIDNMLSGQFPFGINTQGMKAGDVEMMAAMMGVSPQKLIEACQSPPLATINPKMLKIRAKLCQGVLEATR